MERKKREKDPLLIPNFNDKGYRYLLSFSKLFKQFIEIFLPQWKDKIDLKSLEKVNKSFITNEFKDKESDIIYKGKLTNKEIYLYILVEPQTKPDKTMPFRLNTYINELWMDVFRTWTEKEKRNGAKKLPAILPIVFYTGIKKWDISLEFYDYVDGADLLRPYTPDFKYILVELKKYNDKDFKDCLKSFGAALLLDRYSAEKDIKAHIHTALKLIDLESDKEIWTALMIWINHFIYNKREKDEHESLSEQVINSAKTSRREKEAIEMSITMAESLRKEGREEGLEEGKILEGKSLVMKQITLKWGKIPLKIKKRLENLNDIKEVESIGMKIINCDNIEDIYALN